jgi:hypothetical protein
MTNEELDKAVAELQGWKKEPDGRLWRSPDKHIYSGLPYRPSTIWKQAGELLEKYNIQLDPPNFGSTEWSAAAQDIEEWSYADTPQRAICLAVLALKGEK